MCQNVRWLLGRRPVTPNSERIANRVAGNVEGLAMGWYSMHFQPGRLPIEKPKPKVNTKSRYLFVCWNCC
jgi:hypothetical protein